jgi:hypothetical protein
MILKPRRAILALLACATLDAVCGHVAFGAVRAVALRGQQAPGLPAGETFATGFFSAAPTINNDGHVAFRAQTQVGGNDARTGIWTDRSGTLELLMVSGSATPEDATVTYAPGIETYINNAGNVFFEGDLSGPTVVYPTFMPTAPANNYGIWSDGSGSIAKVARDGDAAPGVVAPYFLAGITRPLFNDDGKAVIQSHFVNSMGNSAPAPPMIGVFSNRTGTLQKIVANGDPAPGIGGEFAFFSSQFLTSYGGFNDNNDFAFSARTTTDATGIWMTSGPVGGGSPGPLALVVGPGTSTQGVLPGVTFRYSILAGFNNARQIGINSALQGAGVTDQNDDSLWLWSSNDLQLVAREGQLLTGTSYIPKSFVSTNINDDGTYVFAANVSPGFGTNYGIFSADANGARLIALGGQHAPGTPAGVVFNEFIGSTGNVAINGGGQVAFIGDLVGASSSSNQGLWATDRAGVLRLIAREGDPIEYLPGQFGIIESLGSNPRTGNERGDKITFNDRGEVVFSATGTNFGWGVFVSDVATIPEPSAFALLICGVIGWPRRRRQDAERTGVPRRAI